MKTESLTTADASPAELPLPTLLSQILVSFTIEFDNEFECRTPHWTTIGGKQAGVWLASMAMWSNLMRLLPEEGAAIGELKARACTPHLQLPGMQRWGYIVVAPDPRDERSRWKGTGPVKDNWTVRPTLKGRLAQQVWAPLFAEIEDRWRTRYGAGAFDDLRETLAALVRQLDIDLPEYLPVLGYGLVAEVLTCSIPAPARDSSTAAHLTLPALLSKALLAFTLEFERESDVSLAICANVLRLFEGQPLRVSELPRLSGVSKESIAMATGFLKARRCLVIEPDPETSRGKVIRLAAEGHRVRIVYRNLLGKIEERWRSRFGAPTFGNLRESLEAIAGASEAGQPLLMKAFDAPSGCWRASVRRPDTLPHHPMVLHRGGYPDGS